MKKIIALLGLLSFQAFGITNVTLPYLIDTASIPKIRYVDKNDSALKWGINNLGDTVNASTGTGNLVRKTSPTLSGLTVTGTLAAANGTYSGTLGVTGVATFTAAPVLSSVTASLPLAANGSQAVITSPVTGTGSTVVMSTSPTLVTPVLGAATATTLTTSGNVGVGTASPNLISANRALTLSSPLSGEEFVSLELQGKRTTDANFANLNFYNNGTRVSAISGMRSGANNSGALVFTTANAGSLADVLTISPTGGITSTSLTGTGTRLVTATSTGIVGNATSVSGANTWADIQTLTLAPVFSSVTASLPLAVNSGKSLITSPVTGTGSTVVMSTSPTLVTPTFSGTVASGLTASRTVITDGSGNFAVNTETGTGSHARAISPAFTGTVSAVNQTFSGNVSQYGATIANSGYYMSSTSGLTGTSQYGLNIQPTLGSGATTLGSAGYLSLVTPNTSFTMTSGIGLNIADAQRGAASTITTQYGLKVEDQTMGGTNYSIYTGLGSILFGNLTGTGTRLVTATSTGLLSNATTIAGANTWSAAQTFTLAPIFSSVTASLPLAVDGSKGLITSPVTGTGSTIVMSVSPAFTGTVTGVNQTLSGTLGVTGLSSLATMNTTGNVGIGTTSNNLIGTADRALTISTPQSTNEYVSLELRGQRTGGDANFAGINFYDVGNRMAAISAGRSGADNSGNIVFSVMNAGSLGDVLTIAKTGAVSLTNNLTVSGTTTFSGALASAGTSGGYDEGTFTFTLTGCTTSPTGTATYVRVGKSVTLYFPAVTGTSNTTSCTLTGLPSSLQPATQNPITSANYVIVDGGTETAATTTTYARFGAASGTITLLSTGSTSGFSSSGTKGIRGSISDGGNRQFVVNYTLQ